MRKHVMLRIGFAMTVLATSLFTRAAYASSEPTLFTFRSFMPADRNCEGVAWQKGKEGLANTAYASWDARKRKIWIGIDGRVYVSGFRRTEGERIKVVEADFGDIHAVVSIPTQAVYDPKSHSIGMLELLSKSTNKSLTKIEVSVSEAC